MEPKRWSLSGRRSERLRAHMLLTHGAFICDESAFDREDLRALSSCAATQHYPPAGSSTGTLPLFIVCCFGAARHGNVLAFG